MFKKSLIYLFLIIAVGFSIYPAYTYKGAASASTSTPPQTVMQISADIAYARDEKDLIQQAILIIVGTPIGTAKEIMNEQTRLSGVSAYFQDVKVLEVLKGRQGEMDTVRVVRAGISSQAQRMNAIQTESLAGELSGGTLVLFLGKPAESGVFVIVGHTSGHMSLNANGRIAGVAEEVQSLQGLTLEELKQKIAALSSAQ